MIAICPHYLFYDNHIALLSFIVNFVPRLLELPFPTIMQYFKHDQHVLVLLIFFLEILVVYFSPNWLRYTSLWDMKPVG